MGTAPDNTDYVAKAFDFVSDGTKQLITLSTAILTLTFTFAGTIFGTFERDGRTTTAIPEYARWLLGTAWVLYLICIIAGLVALFAWVSQLEPKIKTDTRPTIRTGTALFMVGVQQITFFLATLAIVAIGIVGFMNMS
jgi:hypothetical protein